MKGKDGVLGRLLVLWLNKCKGFLERNRDKYGWYQDQVCLVEHLLVGPFNFEGKKSAEVTYVGNLGKNKTQIHLSCPLATQMVKCCGLLVDMKAGEAACMS